MVSHTVLITGASGGIGRAVAERFAQAGCRVALHYHRAQAQTLALEERLRRGGAEVFAVQADVTDERETEAMAQAVRRRLGFVDILVNNAGIAQQKLFTQITPEEWDAMFAVHVRGAYNCCRAMLPDMIRGHRGAVVNVSSIWGVTGASCEVHYSAAKAALIGMTKALAKEIGPSGIRVNCVAPGVIDTAMNARLDDDTMEQLREGTPLCRIGKPEEVARAIYFLASEEASFITGQTLGVDGGFGL